MDALLYDLDWGEDQTFFEAIKAKGKVVGAGASQRPTIPKRLFPYWTAFVSLHERRGWSQSGPQPISYTELKSFIQLKFPYKGADQVRRLLKFAEELDNAYLADFADRRERSQPA